MKTREELITLAESALFLRGETGMPVSEIASLLEIKREEVKVLMAHVESKLIYNTPSVYELITDGEIYKLGLKKANLSMVRDALAKTNEEQLSKSVIETLTIVAYNQPLVRSKIESIRGSAADYALRILRDLELIEVIGKDKTLKGHPSIYQTTPKFLEMFNLNSLKDLPEQQEVNIDEATREMKKLFEFEMTKEFEAFDLD